MAPLLSSETESQNTLRTEKKHYKNAGKRVDAIKLERDVTVDITCAVSDDAIIAASNKECMLYFVEISLDGVGVAGPINSTHSYPKDCRNARDMFVSNGSLFFVNDWGVLKMDLNSNSHVSLVSKKTCSCTEVHGIAPFGDNGDIVFTDVGSQQVKIASSRDGHVEVIAGTGETGNSDGSRASFSQPMGICVENNKTILVTDAQ